MMELEALKWVALGLLSTVVYFLKRTLDGMEGRVKTLEDEQKKIPSNYLHRDDFREFKLELRSMFDELKADIKELKQR